MPLGMGTQVSLTHGLCGRSLTGMASVSLARAVRARPVDSPHAKRYVFPRQPEVNSLVDPQDREPLEYAVSFLRSALARGPPSRR